MHPPLADQQLRVAESEPTPRRSTESIDLPIRIEENSARGSMLPVKTATRQFAGLVLVPVIPERLEALRDLLGLIAEQTTQAMKGGTVPNPIIDFAQLQTIHYARFVLLEKDVEVGPLLAFSTNYDGPEGKAACREPEALRFHTSELALKAGAGLQRVFSCCRGYREGDLANFLRRNQKPASTFYVGSSGRSRNQILWEAGLRREVERLVDAGDFARAAPDAVRAAVRAQLGQTYPEIPTFPAQPDLRKRLIRPAVTLALPILIGVVAGLLAMDEIESLHRRQEFLETAAGIADAVNWVA